MAYNSLSNKYEVSAEQTGRTYNSATYRMSINRLGGAYYAYKNKLFIQNHSGRIYTFAMPYIGSGGYTYSNTSKAYVYKNSILDWYFYYNYRGDAGYEYYIAFSNWSGTFTVNIDRGSKREGSKKITVGVSSDTGSSSSFKSCLVDLTLYTSKIPDPSGLSISTTVDNDRSKKERYITVNSSFTNPEGWYGGGVYEGNTYVGPVGSFKVKITKDMYNKTKTYTLKVWGNDYGGTSKSTTTVTILPSGVGVTVKKSGNPKEVKEVWYKDNWGNIHEITELWVRRNSNNYETVK